MTNPKQSAERTVYSRPAVGKVTLSLGILLLIASIALSVSVGAANIDLAAVWRSILSYDPSREVDQIIISIRLPRELGAALVGAALAVSGAIMQGMTRNPLADPGLLGLNAGATFAFACLLAFHSQSTYLSVMIVSFLGAGIGAGMVYGLGALKRGGMSPIRITLAGAAVSALLTALGEGIALKYKMSQDLAFWIAGGVSGTNWLQLKLMFPVVLAGILLAIAYSHALTVLSFGDDVAKGLGQRASKTKGVLLLIVLMLAGSAVSLVGSIAFVGLLVPHMCRFLVGTDYRWVIPCSAVVGSIVLVLADTAARMVNPPFETPAGAIVSMIGLPFFLYLARKGGRKLS